MESTEQRILNAALKVFASEGYSGATTRKIAIEADVNEVTLFRKFQSKENLLKEVLINNQSMFSEINSLLQVDKHIDFETELRVIGKKIAQIISNRKADSKRHMFMHMLFEEGRRRPEVAEVLSSFFKMNIKPLSEYFEFQIKNGKMRNVNPRSAALTFISYFVYTSILREVLGDNFLGDCNEEIERFVDIFINGTLENHILRQGE